MKLVEEMTAKELYEYTKSKLYPNSSNSVQVWVTNQVMIEVRGIAFYIKASKAANNSAYVHIYGTKNDEIDLSFYDEFRTVSRLIEAIDKELIKLANKILKGVG